MQKKQTEEVRHDKTEAAARAKAARWQRGTGADDEHGSSSTAGSGRRQGEGMRALSPRGERQGREVRVLLGQGVPLVPPQGSTHLRSLPSLEVAAGPGVDLLEKISELQER